MVFQIASGLFPLSLLGQGGVEDPQGELQEVIQENFQEASWRERSQGDPKDHEIMQTITQ